MLVNCTKAETYIFTKIHDLKKESILNSSGVDEGRVADLQGWGIPRVGGLIPRVGG